MTTETVKRGDGRIDMGSLGRLYPCEIKALWDAEDAECRAKKLQPPPRPFTFPEEGHSRHFHETDR